MSEAKDLDILWDSKDVARYLKLAPKTGHHTVEGWVKKGKLRAARAGDLYRFRKQDVDQMLFSQD